MNQVEHLLAVRNRLGEGPLWHPEEAALYWVDIEGHCFYKLDPASGELERFDVGLPVGALAFRERGGLLLATRDGFAYWDPGEEALRYLVDPEADKPGSRFNDGAVDRHGRFWAGTMGDGDHNSRWRRRSGGPEAQLAHFGGRSKCGPPHPAVDH